MGNKKHNTFKINAEPLLAGIIIVLHVVIAYYCLYLLSSNSSDFLDGSFDVAHLDGREFFSQLFSIGLFLYSSFIAASFLGFRSFNPIKSVVCLLALSVAISTLLASDEYSLQESSYKETPKEFSSMIFILITQRQPLLLLSAFTLILMGFLSYHLFKYMFKVEYTGTGFQIRLPGQTMYYIPIYPQISWQNTGIRVEEGEKLNVEVSGYVSPGALQEIGQLQEHMSEFVKYQKEGGRPEAWAAQLQSLTWPYTGPNGYKKKWYGPKRKLDILKKHNIYNKDYYFNDDKLLTIKGMPHNKVIGIIRSVGDPKPREADINSPAYDWSEKDHRDQLICLSHSSYPITIEAQKSGELYVVINDVDLARWDNSGLFFLKVTKTSW